MDQALLCRGQLRSVCLILLMFWTSSSLGDGRILRASQSIAKPLETYLGLYMVSSKSENHRMSWESEELCLTLSGRALGNKLEKDIKKIELIMQVCPSLV